MYRALVCCRAGMGSSMLLKIKADQVIKQLELPIETEHGNLDSLVTFTGDLVITMDGLEHDIVNKVPYVIGVDSVVNKAEMAEKLQKFMEWKKNQ